MESAFWDKMKAIYKNEDGDENGYAEEQPSLQIIFEKLEEQLKDTYTFVDPIGRGGSGIVVRIHDSRLGIDRALKTPRPAKEELRESLKNEIAHLTAVKR